MSKRQDILDGKDYNRPYGLIYTEVLGWIDLGHAQGTDIKQILKIIDAGELSGKDRYEVTYSQSMVDPTHTIKIGKAMRWSVKRGRSKADRHSIALGMMMRVARKFEGLQASFPISIATDSGFSGEDLVSDLLGFYRVVSSEDPIGMLRPVGKQEALKRWDYYGKIGGWKNYDFCPLLFPDPERFKNSRPRKGVLPKFMQTVKPWNDFQSGIVRVISADGNYMDKARGGSLPYA